MNETKLRLRYPQGPGASCLASAIPHSIGIGVHIGIGACRDANLLLEQIAQELGYSSVGHFTRMFVAATGHPPEGFRAASRVSDDLRD